MKMIVVVFILSSVAVALGDGSIPTPSSGTCSKVGNAKPSVDTTAQWYQDYSSEDASSAWVITDTDGELCRAKCLEDSSCVAYWKTTTYNPYLHCRLYDSKNFFSTYTTAYGWVGICDHTISPSK